MHASHVVFIHVMANRTVSGHFPLASQHTVSFIIPPYYQVYGGSEDLVELSF